jgi:hypothetical protein
MATAPAEAERGYESAENDGHGAQPIVARSARELFWRRLRRDRIALGCTAWEARVVVMRPTSGTPESPAQGSRPVER